VAGQALVLHTLAAFAAVPRVASTLVVIAPDDRYFDRLETVLPARCAGAPCGGATRAQSVAQGLAALRQLGAADHDWVLVHDAARCLITPALVERLIDACQHDAVGGLLAHPVSDTLKLATDGRVSATPDRIRHWLAQTPQMFRIGLLRTALQAVGEGVTDESSAIEALGLAPKLVAGSASNFKVTYAEDFALAQAILQGRRRPTQDLDYDYP
jgi:2-C-methyl-D-erythritol 4-phosphate cytidylyltransferase